MTVEIRSKRVGPLGEYHGEVRCARTGNVVYVTHAFSGHGAKVRAREAASKFAREQGYEVKR